MLTDHYISELSRQRILREVAMRAQKAVFDVAYSWYRLRGSILVTKLTSP